jgi:tRNA dimethylallyltransferase
METVKPLLVIVGPTASGKTAMAIEIAKQFNGEVICADSRTVYKYMDISTAKPDKLERAQVTHHLLDVVEPSQKFSAAVFKTMAQKTIDDIHSRDKLPILVGGSGLYIDALVYDYQFSKPGAARNPLNPRHLAESTKTNNKLRDNTILVGINISNDVLAGRITSRVDNMVQKGLVNEIESVAGKYGWGAPALQAPAFKAFKMYIEGDLTLDEAKQGFVSQDKSLAKRQKTWFKRNAQIQWVDNIEQATLLVERFLSNSLLQ